MFIHVRCPTRINWNINLPHLHWAGGKFDCLNFPLEIDCNLCLQATGDPQSQGQTRNALWSAHTGVCEQKDNMSEVIQLHCKCMLRVQLGFKAMWDCRYKEVCRNLPACIDK